MNNIYYKRMQKLPDRELYRLVANPAHYVPEAVEAASTLLNERKKAGTLRVTNPPPTYREVPTHADRDYGHFSLRRFWRTFSYRDVLTIFSLSIFFLTCSELINFYSDERWLKGNHPVGKDSRFLRDIGGCPCDIQKGT